MIFKITQEACRVLLKFHQHINPLLETMRDGNYPDNLTVVFEEVFLEPQHIVLLATIFESFIKAGSKVQLITPDEGRLYKYLKSLRIDEYWGQGFDRTKYTHLPNNEHAFCLWHVSPSMISQFRDAAGKFFENKFFPGVDLTPLTQSMAEAFNNINEHAKSPISGYTITQYFPERKKLIMAVCDLGVGIPTTINAMLETKGRPRMSDNNATEHALELRVTSQSTPKNKGYGLAHIINYVRNYEGSLMILSNFACLHIRASPYQEK